MARGHFPLLDAREVPKMHASHRRYLIDFRSLSSRVPSYKRSTRLVMAKHLQDVPFTD